MLTVTLGSGIAAGVQPCLSVRPDQRLLTSVKEVWHVDFRAFVLNLQPMHLARWDAFFGYLIPFAIYFVAQGIRFGYMPRGHYDSRTGVRPYGMVGTGAGGPRHEGYSTADRGTTTLPTRLHTGGLDEVESLDNQ
jgi:hypothetical protein